MASETYLISGYESGVVDEVDTEARVESEGSWSEILL